LDHAVHRMSERVAVADRNYRKFQSCRRYKRVRRRHQFVLDFFLDIGGQKKIDHAIVHRHHQRIASTAFRPSRWWWCAWVSATTSSLLSPRDPRYGETRSSPMSGPERVQTPAPDGGQRITRPTRQANAAKIQTAGSFIDLAEVERWSPCERSEETNRLPVLLCSYIRRRPEWQGHAPTSAARMKHK
jgi:hypothetical protein